MSLEEIKTLLCERAEQKYQEKEAEFPDPARLRDLERIVLLKVIDARWMNHIDDMEQLKQGIGLMGYGQRDPKVEYRMIGFEMFDEMNESIQEGTLRILYHIRIEQNTERREEEPQNMTTNRQEAAPAKPVTRKEKKIYPNDPCPCGSGKKYKNCHGRKGAAPLN